MRSEVVVKIGHPGFHYIDRGDTVLHRELFFSMISDWRLAIISDQRFSISLMLGNTRVPDPFRGLRGVRGRG